MSSRPLEAKVDAAAGGPGRPADGVTIYYARKHAYTTLELVAIPGTKGRPTTYRYNLRGSYQGQGYVRTWACHNKYRAQGAGKKAQDRLDQTLTRRHINRRRFR